MEDEAVFLMDHDLRSGSKFSTFLDSTLRLTPFISAFLTSYALIIVNELGDKTFFIAAVLAMKRGASITFVGSGAALVLMTLISAMAGRTLPALLNPIYTHYASVALFVCFGLKMLWEGYNMPDGENGCGETVDGSGSMEEPAIMREIELELSNNAKPVDPLDSLERGARVVGTADGGSRASSSMTARASSAASPLWPVAKTFWRRALVSAAFTEAFTMTFAAEWGDRSQIATLALGASKNIYGVNLGAMTAHLTCTALAVFGGRMLVSRLSEKTISIVGGVTFLVFAFAGIFL